MSQVPGNYDNKGVPLPSVDVKPVEAANDEPIPQKSWWSRTWDGLSIQSFGEDFVEGQQAVGQSSSSNAIDYDFGSLFKDGEQSENTNRLLMQLFIFIGLMVLLLFAFKFFRK